MVSLNCGASLDPSQSVCAGGRKLPETEAMQRLKETRRGGSETVMHKHIHEAGPYAAGVAASHRSF